MTVSADRTLRSPRRRRHIVPQLFQLADGTPISHLMRILVACRDCGETRVGPDDVTIRTCANDGSVAYRFTCRRCGRPTVSRTRPGTATRALLAGAQLEVWSYPLELDEQRAGPPLGIGDIVELCDRMAGDDWITELAD